MAKKKVAKKKENKKFYAKLEKIKNVNSSDEFIKDNGGKKSNNFKSSKQKSKTGSKKFISHLNKFQKENVNDLQWIDLIKFTINHCNFDTQEIAKVQLLELYPEISEEQAED